MPETPEERRSDLAVLEANEHKQRRRLQEILDAHKAVETTADKLFQMQAAGEVSPDARNIGIQHAVKKFVRESQNLLTAWDREEADEDVPDPWRTSLGTIEMRSEPDIEIVGLHEFLNTQETYTEHWSETVAARHGPNTTMEHSAQHTVPKKISWEAHMLLWEFLNAEYDIDVQFEDLDDSLPTWGFDEIDAEIEDTADLARDRLNDDSGEEAANGD